MNNGEDEDSYVVVEEPPMENIISKDNICYGQARGSAFANTRHTTMSTVARESHKNSKGKTKLIISTVVIVLILSAICVCTSTVYTLLELSRFKSEIAYINNIMASFQTMNASLDVIHQQINDLAGTFNTSIQQILVRENEKEQITNASLDVLHQKTNDLFSFHPASCAAVTTQSGSPMVLLYMCTVT